MFTRIAVTISILFLELLANEPVCRAETTIAFPSESIGSLYCASPSKVFHGAGKEINGLVSEWEYLGAAAGRAQLPNEKLVQLRLTTLPTNPLEVDWVSKIPPHAIYSLSIADVQIRDEHFSEFAAWVGLRELHLRNCGITSAIANDLGKLKELKSIAFSKLPSINDEVLANVALLPNLEDLSIHQGNITDTGVALLANCRSLSFLKMDSVAVTDAAMKSLIKLPKLVGLNVYAPEPEFRDHGPHTKITDAGLEHIGKCTQLQSLNIHGATVSADGLRGLFQRCPRIRYLALSESAVKVGGLEAATALSFLETVRITGMDLDDKIAAQLSRLRNLREIIGIFHIGNEGVEQLSNLTHLKSLWFSGNADDRCMSALAKLRALKELAIENTQITDGGLSLLRGLSLLESVTINGSSFTSRCLETASTWPKLKSLSLRHLEPRSDGKSEWNDIHKLSPTVSSLRFELCPTINDDHIKSICTLPNLESLELQANDLRGITDQGARHLARASRLKSLSIYDSSISDNGLESLRSLSSLEQLELQCMATPKSLDVLASMKSLRVLIIGSPDLSKEDVANLRTRYPHKVDFRFQNPHISRAKSEDKQDLILRRGSVTDRTRLNALEGKVAPDLTVTSWTNSNGEMRLEDFRGKVVLLDFWGKWCGACLKALPKLRELHDMYHKQGLVIVSIHSTDDAESLGSFLKTINFPWANCIDTENQTAEAYAVERWPSVYLIDRDGILKIVNPRSGDLEQAVQFMLDR